MTIWKWLLYITNNDDESRDEQMFDIGFFVVNTLALIVGSIVLLVLNEFGWIAFLVIEYTWALDNMRHNRP
jgi:hypothetical protein